MTQPPDEYELALRARDGDREALSELLERSRLRLFALAYTLLGHYDDAQDAVAAAVLQICRHVGDLREPERVWAWMQSIVRNEARLRRRRTAGSAAADEGASSPATSSATTLQRLDGERAL